MDVSEGMLSQISVDQMTKITMPELKAFIGARRINIALSKYNKQELVYLDMASRNEKHMLLYKLNNDLVSEESTGGATFQIHNVSIGMTAVSSTYQQASGFLGNIDCVLLCWFCFNYKSKFNEEIVSVELKTKAYKLQSVLNNRLTCHIRQRISDREKRQH